MCRTHPPPSAEPGGRSPPQRVDDAHFRQCWIAVDPVERLLDAGLITPAERLAANRFRATWDFAFRGSLKAQDWNAVRAGRHRGKPTMISRGLGCIACGHAAFIR